MDLCYTSAEIMHDAGQAGSPLVLLLIQCKRSWGLGGLMQHGHGLILMCQNFKGCSDRV